VNTPRSDEDRLELIEFMVFLSPSGEKVRVEVYAVDLQVFAVRLILLLLVQKFLLFGLTNWCCSLNAVSEGFNQIIDFLNESSSKYALTMNPNIYVSCIKPFWTTIAVKKVNDVTRLQALVDKKKVVITEASIRDVLRLDDAEGIECLPNEEIFAELARMGYEKPSIKLTFYKASFSSQWKFLILTIQQCMSTKRTSWNEFSSSMASVVICLSSGKGFSRVETPLFEGMIVEQQVTEGDADEVHDEGVLAVGVVTEGVVSTADDVVPTADEEPSISSPTPPTPPPQPSHDIASTS
nr:xylulose kinase-1 [Tanacetum cinerariifolium]